ncbi:MAG: hypothetical protein ABI583_12370 [Betaproteobacteria bacterium]
MMLRQFAKFAIAITTIVTSSLLPVACTQAAQANVEGNILESRQFPAGNIIVDAAYTYVGMTEFVLYGVANCEIHVFAALDGNRVKSFYWIQFEGYLPDNRNTYQYNKDPQRTMIGGHAFHERVFLGNVEEARSRQRPGSDSAAVRKLLEEKGYLIGPEVMQLRLVRLDENARRELMIIYSENLDTHGLKAADLAEGGNAFTRREEMIDGLRQRAVAGLKMQMK